MKTICTTWAILLLALADTSSPAAEVRWRHLTSARGELPVPGTSTEQTGSLIGDFDRDGTNDFVLSFRQKAPALVLYRGATNWTRLPIEFEFLPIEAGGAAFDIDRDTDLDIVFGADYQGNQVWWWENPSPEFDPNKPWKRHLIKNSGANQHHDQIFGDFKGNGQTQLAFWNQRARKLFLADIPNEPRESGPWPLVEIFSGANEGDARSLEGLALGDVDRDNQIDLLAGSYWFKRSDRGQFLPTKIGEIGGRIAVGRFREGTYPQIVIAPGDGIGPLTWYECKSDPHRSDSWAGRKLINRDLIHGHSLAIGDIDKDGKDDIFAAEMAKWRESQPNPDHAGATAWIFYGNGKGDFTQSVLSTGMGYHEARLADLDGDGDLDILNKPYNWQTPRVDVWLNEGLVGVQIPATANPAP